MNAGTVSDDAVFPFGPVQMLVISSERDRFTGEILPELRRLTDDGLVRLIDLLLVTKKNGEIETIQESDLGPDEALEFGVLVGALIGFGVDGEEGAELGAVVGASELEDGHVLDPNDAWYLGDIVPDDGWAAVALIEHRWAIPLRDRIVDAGGVALADEWIHPADLIAVGAALAEDKPAAVRR
jgi:Family of unknown function (DUF6325)